MPSVPKAESVSNSYCIACGFLELYYMAAAYAMYDFYVKNDVGEEGEKWTMLMGIASAGQLILYAVEMVLGFCNCDDNKIWGFLFMIGSAAMVVFSIASASYCLDKEAIVTYATLVQDLGGEIKSEDNEWYFYFAVITAPIVTRFLGIFLKFKDLTRGSE